MEKYNSEILLFDLNKGNKKIYFCFSRQTYYFLII